MRVAVVGAGFAGLAAAYDLARWGHRPVVFEASSEIGGLASGFRAPGWEWKAERFYHHVFTSDRAILDLTREIGASDLLIVRRPRTAYWCDEHPPHAFDCAGAVLRYPHLPLASRLRVGAAVALLRSRRDWRRLERTTADRWLRRAMGPRAYGALWQPLLAGKFGAHHRDVNMAWFWARIATRTPRLGYFAGGFQALAERLATHVRSAGGEIRLSAPVRAIRRADTSDAGAGASDPGTGASEVRSGGRLVVRAQQEERFDAVLATTSPSLLSRLAPELPSAYGGRLAELDSLGAVVLALALDRAFLDETYWLNTPAGRFPFQVLVEHTNFVSPAHYGGQHLLYAGSYAEPSSALFAMSPDEALALIAPALREIRPDFDERWVRGAWLHREPYAQPIVRPNHSARVPPLATPLPGLFWASMSQVYPWDRGTSFAVTIGRRAAREIVDWLRVPERRLEIASETTPREWTPNRA